jgi:hypothetical protein
MVAFLFKAKYSTRKKTISIPVAMYNNEVLAYLCLQDFDIATLDSYQIAMNRAHRTSLGK